MDDLTERKVKDIAICHLRQIDWLKDNGNGTFTGEIYADYRDEMSAQTATDILTSPEPEDALFNKLLEWYSEEEFGNQANIIDAIMDTVRCSGEYTDDELDDIRDYVDELVCETVWWEYPVDHYLRQTFHVDIFVDTGDGNYDYTLNSLYPCYYGKPENMINDKASIVWLAKKQGYRKQQLKKELQKGDLADPRGFMESMRQELANLPSAMAVLTFLVEMSLGDLIQLNNGIRMQERNGRFYDATKIPYCGYIVLDKNTETGLYDMWSGGGSVFEIQLEKDVRLPIRFIRSALPDGGDGYYSVERTYGMSGSVWQENMVKKIKIPKLEGGKNGR